jgi:hypothetical protein
MWYLFTIITYNSDYGWLFLVSGDSIITYNSNILLLQYNTHSVRCSSLPSFLHFTLVMHTVLTSLVNVRGSGSPWETQPSRRHLLRSSRPPPPSPLPLPPHSMRTSPASTSDEDGPTSSCGRRGNNSRGSESFFHGAPRPDGFRSLCVYVPVGWISRRGVLMRVAGQRRREGANGLARAGHGASAADSPPASFISQPQPAPVPACCGAMGEEKVQQA